MPKACVLLKTLGTVIRIAGNNREVVVRFRGHRLILTSQTRARPLIGWVGRRLPEGLRQASQ